MINFEVGKGYSRKKIRKMLGIPKPDKIGGIWSTGYVQYKDNYFVFVTISEAGRTGHDYQNILKDNILYWYTKGTDHFYVPTIQKMVSGDYPVHFFIRYDSANPEFIYRGLGYMKDFEDGKPALISWEFESSFK